MRRYSRIAVFLSLAASFSLSGCSPLKPQEDPSRFYVLTSLAEVPASQGGSPTSEVSIGLGSLELAPYLNRSQIVSRVAKNEVTISEIDRWAEPLDQGVRRVIEEDLATLIAPRAIARHPWLSVNAPDLSVDISLLRFERDASGNAELLARWWLHDLRSGERSSATLTRVNEPVESGSTEALVEGLSRALARLSNELGAAIRSRVR
jgi:uncharacterized lipoprotein YmbA